MMISPATSPGAGDRALDHGAGASMVLRRRSCWCPSYASGRCEGTAATVSHLRTAPAWRSSPDAPVLPADQFHPWRVQMKPSWPPRDGASRAASPGRRLTAPSVPDSLANGRSPAATRAGPQQIRRRSSRLHSATSEHVVIGPNNFCRLGPRWQHSAYLALRVRAGTAGELAVLMQRADAQLSGGAAG
jgi:hypothetical protein